MWPQSLKTIVRVMLDSRYAMWMLWGPELTFFCNDAYLPTVGIKRDWVLGARSDKVWEEIWPDIGPRIGRCSSSGQATWDEGLLLFLERSGFPEETYHTFSYSPVYDDGGRIAGMLCVVTEVTERVIGERRLHMLRDLGRASFRRASASQDSCRRAVETCSPRIRAICRSRRCICSSPTARAHGASRCSRRLPRDCGCRRRSSLTQAPVAVAARGCWSYGSAREVDRSAASRPARSPRRLARNACKRALVLPLTAARPGRRRAF